MTTAREIMTSDVRCVRTSDSVRDAASMMADLGVGALPIRGEDNQLKGMLTDRDIVVKVLAAGKDPLAMHAGELAQGQAMTVDANADATEILRTMAQYQVRRLPVTDGSELVGIVSQADVARTFSEQDAGTLLAVLSTDF